ncbi:DUF302 domain-containing protein [Thiobacillus denitrificans]|uniref:DUF302 domain-containing protein n=1 Tax=Thiobacillus denitrificans TaxID=36861 RepID=UPI000365E9DA|nr:DUF302 domain-containing protein [Thiobacillus denitrificans]
MKNPLQWMATACLTLLLCAPVAAGDLMMARVNRMFPEAMTLLQSAISSRGYTVTRLQQVNENLQRREFKSDMYRVVYFGKYEEVRQATARNPGLIPFLPLNITIFAEGDQAILVTSHPQMLREFFPDPELKPLFERWEKDMLEIMDEVREAA